MVDTTVNLLDIQGHQHRPHSDHPDLANTSGSLELISEHDPHIWLSPDLAAIILKRMYTDVRKQLPEQAHHIDQNFKETLKIIKETDQLLDQCTSQSNVYSFVSYHPSYAYFARQYNLKMLSVELDGLEPSVAEMQNLLENIKRHKARSMIIQPEFDQRIARQIAREADLNIVELSPLDPDWPVAMQSLCRIFVSH